MAVVEARTFNYIAYSNRAIAADLVAMATMHAYMSMMSSEVDMLGAAEVNMFIIAGEEFLLCCSCGPPFVCCKLQHCWHGVQAIMKGLKFNRYKGKYAKKLKGLESMFNKSIMLLRRMIDAIHISQELMLYDTANVLRGQKLDEIRKFNDPQSSKSLPALVGVKNVENLLCGVQGTPLDSLCPHNKLSKDVQAKLLGEVSNATRPKFTTDRGLMDIWMNLLSTFGNDLTHKIQGNGISFPVYHKGTAKLTPGTSGLTSSQEAIDAKDVGAEDHGWLFSIFHDGVSVFPYNAHIYSDKNGGEHKPGEVHKGRHSEFKGLHSCMLFGSCFIKFRADSKVKDHYDQPLVYDYATRDLSVTRKGGHGPWELNKQGKVEMRWGGRPASSPCAPARARP